MKRNMFLLASLLLVFVLNSCDSGPKSDPAHIKEVEDWHKRRVDSLKVKNGWLSLSGLYWLKEGENKFGSGKENDIIFPEGKAPAFIGTIIKNGKDISIKVEKGINVTVNDSIITEMVLVTDLIGKPTKMKLGSLAWTIIDRVEKVGIRMWDSESEILKNFKGIERFPVDAKYKIEARFEPYNPPKKLTIPTAIGTIEEEDCKGALVFSFEGKEYRLDPRESEKDLWLIFADETSGEETYGAGRFLYVPKPDSTGKTIIDFNKSYNPPCAFTPYATCPLPPSQNILKIKIEAGEKYSGEQH